MSSPCGAVFTRNCLFALLLFSLSMIATRSASAQSGVTKTGGNLGSASVMHAVHRFYQVYNDHNTSLWEQVMAPSYVGHVNDQTVPNREVGKGFVAALLSAFPDIHYSIKDALQGAIAPPCAGRPPRSIPETSSVWRPRRRRSA